MTTTTVKTLSKIDLAAMRQADTICFRKCSGTEGSTIECNKRFPQTERNPFEREETVTIKVDDRFQSYGDDCDGKNYDIRQQNAWRAFDMIHSPSFTEEWQTIVSCLKAGDHITLEWIADNNNGYVKEAGLHVDVLRLSILRGDKRLTFQVQHNICQNNSARMIKIEALKPRVETLAA